MRNLFFTFASAILLYCCPVQTRAENQDIADWYRVFSDPVLDSLIETGRAGNYDLGQASRRIGIARAHLGMARSGYMPSIGLNAGWSRDRQSGRTLGRTGNASTVSYFDGSVTMSWEIDVFGKITRQVKNANTSVKLSSAEYDAAMLSLEATIATTYIGLLVQRSQLAVAMEHSKSQKHIVDITETRHRTGLASKLDVAQAKTLYYSTVASIPKLEAAITSSVNALGVLMGAMDNPLPTAVDTATAMPSYMVPIPMETSMDVIRRRPDVIEAERNIELASSQLGIAKSDYLPSLSLNASVGTQAHAIGDLFSKESFTYSIAPTLSWTIFDGLSRKYNSDAMKLELQNTVDAYNLTILTATQEVADAIARYKATLLYIGDIEQVVENARESVRLSVDLYKQGLTGFSNVVDAQLNYLEYQNSLISAHGEALTTIVDLYKALGGNI